MQTPLTKNLPDVMGRVQMRLIRIVLLSVLVLGLGGCAQETSNSQVQDQNVQDLTNSSAKELDESVSAFQSQSYETRLVFITKQGENWLVVDDKGLIHEVNYSADDVAPGSVCDYGLVTETSPGEYEVVLNYPYISTYAPKVHASYEDAAAAYAELILKNLVYNGDPGYAVSEYNLKSVEVRKAYNQGRLDVFMSFDVKPLQGAFYWGIPESDGFVRNRSFSFTIYGAEDTWLAVDALYPYLEDGKWPTPSETQYTPIGIQKVIYEDDEWSYYSDGIMLPQTEALKEANLTEYSGTINRINRNSGEIEQLYRGDRNTDYKLFTKNADKIYILSDTWVPFSEGRPSYFGVLDLETKEYKQLIEGMVIRGTVKDDKGYLFADDKIMEIDLETSTTRNISVLPVFPNYSYEYVHVNRVMDGKLYFVLSDLTVPKEYVVDLATGKLEAVE